MKRKHSKIDKLPSDIKEAVEQMILGDYTYRDVCDFVRDTANVPLAPRQTAAVSSRASSRPVVSSPSAVP